MNDEIVIRSAKAEDCSQIVEFLKSEGKYKEVWGSEENLISILKQDPDLIQIALKDDQIVGFIIITPHGVNQCFFYRFVVKADLRGQGIGSRILDASEEVVKRRGGKKISLYVEIDNEKAEDFYENRGYISDGIVFKSYFKEFKS